MRKKVTVVGGGFVGSTTAQRIHDADLADVVLTDILEDVPAGKALDMAESAPILGSNSHASGISTASGNYAGTENSDIVVITAGFPRKPGMSRDDLLKKNYEVIKAVVEGIVKLSPNAILIIVTNPLDAMAQAAFRVSGFPKKRVIGMAGVLDSARMSTFVARELGVSVENVTCFVLGGHGDDMVPLTRYSTVAGIPLPELILKDKKKILPCAAYLEGEYGTNGLFVGVPVKLGAGGIEQIIEVKLLPEEKAALEKSSASVRELV